MRVVSSKTFDRDHRSGATAASGTEQITSMLRGSKILAFGQVAVSFLEGVLEAAILTLFARLALRAVETDGSSVYVPGFGDRPLSVGLSILITLIVLRLLFGLLRNFLSSHLQINLVKAMRHEALDSYSGSSWLSQSSLDDGAVQQLIVTLPNGISGQISGLIIHFGHVAIMVAMLSYSMVTDARLTSALILVIIAATFILRPVRALIKRSAERTLVYQKELSSRVADLVGIRFEAQTFGLMEVASAPLRSAIGLEASHAERLSRLKGSVIPLFTTVTYLAVTLSIVVLVNTASDKLASTGPILLVVLRSLSYGTAIQQAAAGLTSLRPSLDLLQRRLNELRDGRIGWGKQQFTRLESCRLVGVTYSYPGTEAVALREVSIEITRGMRLGLVGPSGSGKSTISRLVLGLVQPHGGQILVNGKPLHDYDRDSWSRQLGVVPQAAQVISGSIADNLRFYREGITDEALWEALEVADLRDEIAALPSGLETVIGPGHRALSGGQQQRLAIARAFAARPEFVVMDEPTSSVDVLSEVAIADAIERIPGDITLVIVSHRPQILEYCDQIAIVENGRVSHVGAPAGVLSQSEYLRSITHP